MFNNNFKLNHTKIITTYTSFSCIFEILSCHYCILQNKKTMKTHQRELLIYYNPSSSSDRKTLAYAKSTGSKVKSYEHSKSPSTSTSWKMILKALNKHPKDLLNKAHPYYQDKVKGKDFTMTGWLDVLKRNPDMIKYPIALKGSKAILCSTPTDVLRLI